MLRLYHLREMAQTDYNSGMKKAKDEGRTERSIEIARNATCNIIRRAELFVKKMNDIELDKIKKILKDRKKICLFIGAGASVKEPSSLPSFQELNDEILLNLYQSDKNKNDTERYVTDIHIKPEQLLQILWDDTNGSLNPVECFQFAQPNINHYLITQLILEGVQCIITPNFDPCLEKAMDLNHIPYTMYNRIPDSDEEANLLLHAIKLEKTVLWKPHGDCREKDSLCYTRTKVAKLSNSGYLYNIFSYIIKNFNMMFLGYSGYDDDFYPILYQCIANSQRHTIWNAYAKPEDSSPCVSLQKNAENNFHIWVGDMTELLLQITNDSAVKNETKEQIDWKKYLMNQFRDIKTSKKLSMLAKYLSDYGLSDEAVELWKEGVKLPKEETDREDKLRFQLNLGIIAEEDAYDYAIRHSYFYIAEIALQRIILSAIKSDKQKAQKYLKKYYLNCINDETSEYFKKGNYYSFIYEYKRENISVDEIKLRSDFKIAYQELLNDGEITNALELLVKHYSGIAVQNMGDKSLLQELIQKSQQLIPYGEKRVIAFIYYTIANMAITLDEKSIAGKYHKKSVYLIEMCYSMKVFEGDQYFDIMSGLYHQKAILVRSKNEALRAEKQAIKYADKISAWERRTQLKGYYYGSLCSFYVYTDYNLAKKYGKIAIKYCKAIDNKQSLARNLTYLAVADAMHHEKSKAIKKFKMAYELHIQINEGLQSFYDSLKKCNIELSEII